jgi:two-component system response regulator HupR/HoxA
MTINNGVNFLTQIQKQYPEVVRLMVADFKNMQLCLLGNVAGIYQFLYKPWRPDNLRLIVNIDQKYLLYNYFSVF